MRALYKITNLYYLALCFERVGHYTPNFWPKKAFCAFELSQPLAIWVVMDDALSEWTVESTHANVSLIKQFP